MSKYRTKVEAKKDNPELFKLVKGPSGRNLCRFCHKEVFPPRRTLCSKECAHQWNIRNNWGYAKSQVIKRDKGICALCSLDCRKVRRETLNLSIADRDAKRILYEIPKHRLFKKWYDIDHIIPVAENGCEKTGGVGIQGLRTLCISCHNKESKKLRSRLAAKKILGA